MSSNLFDDAAEEDEEPEQNVGDEAEEDNGDGERDDNDDGDNEDDGDDAAKDSSEEEDDEVENEYDLTDKFIAQEGEEEEEDGDASEGEKERRRRHKRRRERSPELDEEDYQLLEDNQVTGIRRKQKAERKRIRKQNDGDHKTDAQRLQEELFGDDDGGLEEDVNVEPERRRPSNEDEFNVDDGDEMADFIDDDDGRENGDQTRRARRQKSSQGVSSHGVQELQDIFGDVDDLLEMYAEKKAANLLREDGMEEEDMPIDEDDPDAMEAYQKRLREKRAQKKQKEVENAIEPELMERLMMLPLDERIRETDAPERFQISGEADLRGVFSESQLDDAAGFILDHLLGSIEANSEEKETGVRVNRSAASTILEDGIVEVDGIPRDGKQRRNASEYDSYELEKGVTDLSRGLRAVRKKRRDVEEIMDWKESQQARENLFMSLKKVLRELWDQKHEIPLIACFRKEICGDLLCMREEDRPEWTSERELKRRRERNLPSFPQGTVQAKYRRLRRWEVLWAVHDLASKWRALVKRREKRIEAYRIAASRLQQLLAENPSYENEIKPIETAVQDCISSANDAHSMEELDDVDLKFKMVTSGHNLEAFDESLVPGTRRPSKSSVYTALRKVGLDDVVKAMAMSASDFGANLKDDLKRNEPEDPKVMPLDLAYNFVVKSDITLNEAEKVLERARQILMMEILHEPNVRDYVRKNISAHMHVTTEATPAGATQLDAFHPLGCVKRLRKMPASAFLGTDYYLRLHVAEKEGLITVTSEVEDLENRFVQPMLEYYKSSAVSAVSKEWNNERSMIIRGAVQRLVPQIQQETGLKLLNEAKNVVTEAYSTELWRYVSTPPVQTKSEEGETMEKRRLAACCWGEERSATSIVMLDDQGSLVDVLYLPSFSGPQRIIRQGMDYNIHEDPKKADDVRKVVEFCRDNRPQAILVGARNLFCKALKEDMGRIGDFILDAHAQILTSGHDTGTMDVVYFEETLADLWAKGGAALEEFPDHPDTVRRAVALGRLALEPLGVLSALTASTGKEILSLNLHPLQAHAPELDLLKAAERNLMTATAQVGVDINLLAANNWMCSMLNFVPGLGPRKAQSLIQAVRAHEYALSRLSIWKEIWEPGNVVFRNCGPFLKITTKARALVNAEVEAIESARIDPLSYNLAFRLAGEIVEVSGARKDSEDVANVNKAMGEPEAIENFNLEELNSRLGASDARPSDENKISTLIDISMEFLQPDMELRTGSITESAQMKETQFWWMVGETPQTLKPGRRVEALVRFVGINEARCIVPELGGLNADLSAGDISTSGPVDPSDYLKVGQTLAARIKQVKPEEFSVELTTTSAHLNDDVRWEELYSQNGNMFYHVLSHEERRNIEAEKRRRARSKQLAKRNIDHPNFKNVNMNEASAFLNQMPVGEAIFRPSTKSLDLICLSIKIYSFEGDDLIIHRDVKEGTKRGGKLVLGLPLRILTTKDKTDKFDDLDEVLARFVEPLCARYKEASTHRKFKAGIWDEVKLQLSSEASRKPSDAASYCISFDEQRPGIMMIGHILPTLNRTPHREYFQVYSEGYYFRRKMFPSIDKMLNFFKRNPQGGLNLQSQSAPPPPMIPPMPQGAIPISYDGYVPTQQSFYPPGFGDGNMAYMPTQQFQAYQ